MILVLIDKIDHFFLVINDDRIADIVIGQFIITVFFIFTIASPMNFEPGRSVSGV